MPQYEQNFKNKYILKKEDMVVLKTIGIKEIKRELKITKQGKWDKHYV